MAGLEGKTLGSYRVIAQIGSGGMAKIYRAYQPSMDRIVALKVLPEEYAQEEQFLQRFTQEARTIAQLEHRNILPVYDFGDQDGIAYLVMRFLDGGTLKELMKKRRLTLHETADILVQICAALDYAHRRGVIHRDVKPSNIMIDREGAVYLSDFGIAKVLESASHITQTGTSLGTPAYMSPEQCMGITVDRRSDIYSLGVVLYELVVGRTPFQADTPMAVMMAHLHEPLPIPRSINPDLPETLENIILKAMARNLEDRYQTAAEMGTALRWATPPEVSDQIKVEPVVKEPAAPTVQIQPAQTTAAPPLEAEEEKPSIDQEGVAQPAEDIVTEVVEQEATPAIPAAGPEPGAPPAVVEPLILETVVQRGISPPKKGKQPPIWLFGFGLAVLLVVTGLTGGFLLSLRSRSTKVTPTSLVAVFSSTTKPTQTLSSQPSKTSRPTETIRPSETIQPTPTPPPHPVLIDALNDPAFEGKLNRDIWAPTDQDGCRVFQQEGMLSMSNEVRNSLLDCSAWINGHEELGIDLHSIEATFRVDPKILGDGQRTALSWIADLPEFGGIPKGIWTVKCGIVKENNLAVSMWIQDFRMGDNPIAQSVYYNSLPFVPDTWSRIRLQVEPDTMTFSCWLNDQLVGMYNPVSEQDMLKKVIFRPSMLVVRPQESRMTVMMKEPVFLPKEIVPRAAEATRLREGCIPPPEGIVGWWTGDDGLRNMVSPGFGHPEGAWGFAKGMVGQAFAFQNFPNRGGLIAYPLYPELENLQNVTVESWVRIDSGPFKRVDRFLTLGRETLVIRHDGNETPGTLHFYMRINGELRHVWSQRLLRAGVFHHVAGTYDGMAMKLYLDGILVNTTPAKGKVATSNDGIILSGGETLDGLLDEMTLYNRALTADEIKAIFQAGAAGKCRP